MKTSKNETKKYRIPALEKGLQILEYLSIHPGGKSFTEIFTDLNVSRTTVFSTLRNLTDSGYVNKMGNGNYQISLKVYSLGMNAIRQLDKNHVLLPDLLELRDRFGHTVHACSYSNGESIVLEKLDGTGAISFKSYVGEHKPLHLSAGGKAILSYLSDDEFAYYIAGDLAKLTETTLCTPEQLTECREQVRKTGIALDDEEGEAGVYCMGVPLFTSDSRLFGAVSVSMLKAGFDKQLYGVYGDAILQVAENISRKMGFVGAYPPK